MSDPWQGSSDSWIARFLTSCLGTFSPFIIILASAFSSCFAVTVLMREVHLVHEMPVPYGPCQMVLCISRRNGLSAEVVLIGRSQNTITITLLCCYNSGVCFLLFSCTRYSVQDTHHQVKRFSTSLVLRSSKCHHSYQLMIVDLLISLLYVYTPIIELNKSCHVSENYTKFL